MRPPRRGWIRRAAARARGRPRGQALVLFAFMVVVFVGILALVVDLGFLYGQRRYDQNGADAAALAAGQEIASNVAAYDDAGQPYVAVTDAALYALVRQYAGLSAVDFSSSAPTGTNQNPGMDGRDQLAVTLEYDPGDGSGWCYSPSGAAPPRAPAIPACDLIPDGSGTPAYPPLPGANPYNVRVTVSSTTSASFAQALPGWTGSVGPPSPQTDASAPACVSAGSSGETTCAEAVTTIWGSTSFVGSAPVLPLSTCDQQLGVGEVGAIYPLGGSAGTSCGVSTSDWAQPRLLDFSARDKWCDTNYWDYSGLGGYPRPDQLLPNPCGSNRSWGAFTSDGSDNGDANHDRQTWLSVGFGGSLTAGVIVPDYFLDPWVESPSVPSCPTCTEGRDVGLGIYCAGAVGVQADSCPLTPTEQYFLEATTGFYATCPDVYGQSFSGVGCRDATVVTWSTAWWPQRRGGGNYRWTTSNLGGPPLRVAVANLRNFRIYCDTTIASDGDNVCTLPPTTLPGGAGGDTNHVYGRFVAPYVASLAGCATCTGGLSLNGDAPSLSE